MSKVCAICGTGTPGSPGLGLSEDDELVARRIYEAAAEADGAWDEVEALRRQLAGAVAITPEMIARGAEGLAAERISNGYHDDAEACLRAALGEQ